MNSKLLKESHVPQRRIYHSKKIKKDKETEASAKGRKTKKIRAARGEQAPSKLAVVKKAKARGDHSSGIKARYLPHRRPSMNKVNQFRVRLFADSFRVRANKVGRNSYSPLIAPYLRPRVCDLSRRVVQNILM